MTDMPNGSVSVDPAGVTRLGDAYAAQLATYERHLQQLEDLRARYEPAWGDDDMGKQFQKQFDSLADTLKGLITSVKNSLDYTSTGLRLNGKAYEKADDDALKAGRLLLDGLNQLKAPALRRTDAVRVLSDGADDDFAVRARAEDDHQFYRLLLPSDGLTPAMRRPLDGVKPNGIPSHEVEGHGEYHPGIPPTDEFRVLSDGADGVRVLSDGSGDDQPQEYRLLLPHGESDQPVPGTPPQDPTEFSHT